MDVVVKTKVKLECRLIVTAKSQKLKFHGNHLTRVLFFVYQNNSGYISKRSSNNGTRRCSTPCNGNRSAIGALSEFLIVRFRFVEKCNCFLWLWGAWRCQLGYIPYKKNVCNYGCQIWLECNSIIESLLKKIPLPIAIEDREIMMKNKSQKKNATIIIQIVAGAVKSILSCGNQRICVVCWLIITSHINKIAENQKRYRNSKWIKLATWMCGNRYVVPVYLYIRRC